MHPSDKTLLQALSLGIVPIMAAYVGSLILALSGIHVPVVIPFGFQAVWSVGLLAVLIVLDPFNTAPGMTAMQRAQKMNPYRGILK